MMHMLTIARKDELAAHAAAIDALSRECFGDRVSADVWEWAYMRTPFGDPIVTVCYEGERLLGHYAIVPMPVASDTRRLNTFLSMTTMVSPAARGQGLFIKMGRENYGKAKALGVDAVLGFPNEMSVHGFGTGLGWVLPPADYVAAVEKKELVRAAHALWHADAFRLRLDDPAAREWRMARPGASYVWDDGLLYKPFQGGIDLLHFRSPADLERLPDTRVSVLVRGDTDALRPCKSFDYQFGGVGLASSFDPQQVDRQMGLSDVF